MKPIALLNGRVSRCCSCSYRPVLQYRKGAPWRCLHSSAVRRTDGVYGELTAMRVPTPFVEALRQRSSLDHNGPKPTPAPVQPDLTPKKMSDSFHRVVVPLAHDPWLLDNYVNSSGHIRLGTLFMDLDALSGVVAYKHTGDSVMTVTAAVDRIQLRRPLNKICDLELSGQVTFATGRSSMEVSMQVAKAPAEGQAVAEEDVLITCAFTMVSLDPSSKKPVAVAPLLLETEEEMKRHSMGQSNYEAKKALSKRTLRKAAPNEEESALIHAMWARQRETREAGRGPAAAKPDGQAFMEGTRMHNAQIMQPQHRNRHHFMIFGGYLLKQTFELAFCCAAAFAHARPTFLSLDPSTFENPVPVGSVLYLTATVAYTEPDPVAGGTRVQVRVDSRVRSVEHGARRPTGQFSYTFLVDRDVAVVPRTYSEFMVWTDARRRARRVNASIDGAGPAEPPLLRPAKAPAGQNVEKKK